MIYIVADLNGEIQSVYYIDISNATCAVNALPDDFYKYLGHGKYLANPDGLYIKNGWVDYELIAIPENPIIDYTMVSECPVDPSLTRHVYWDGEKHEANNHFTINLLVLHFNPDGSRNRKWDCKTWTRADKRQFMDDPLNVGQMVDEYDFFVSMINSTFMPQLVQLGIYSAENVLNSRIYES